MRRSGGLCSALFLLVGCGDDPIKHLPDGPPAIDAPIVEPDAPPAAVTVTTLARCCTELPGTPQAAVPVAVIQPDGSLGEMAVTAADGKVTFHAVRPGAAITAFYPENATYETAYVTMAGVKPGDDLTFGDHYYQPPLTTGTPGTATLSYPAFANAVHYQMYTSCGFFASDTLSIPITLANTCQTPTSPIVVYAYDINYVLLANAFLPAAATTDGATPTITAWDAYPVGNIAFTLTGAGPEITYSELRAQQQYGAFSENTYSYATATTGTLPTNGLRQYHSLYLNRAGQYGHHYSQSTAAATATSVTFAVPATLPWVGQMAVSSLGATWLQTAGTYDGTVGSFNWSVYDANALVTHYFKWNVIVPAGPTSFSWSQFPASLASRLPPADAFVTGFVELIDLAGDYDAMRALPEWQLTCVDCAVSAGELPHADTAFPYGGGEGFVASPRHTAMVAKVPSAHPQPRR